MKLSFALFEVTLSSLVWRSCRQIDSKSGSTDYYDVSSPKSTNIYHSYAQLLDALTLFVYSYVKIESIELLYNEAETQKKFNWNHLKYNRLAI